MKKKGWEHYSHTADMGIRGFGETKQEAFEQAAVAMIAISVEPEKIKPAETIEITCEGNDDESLLFDWLNKILFEMAIRKMLFSKFEVRIEGNKLAAKAFGERIDLEKHKPVVEIKGATYSDLKVHQDTNGTWVAQCIVDI